MARPARLQLFHRERPEGPLGSARSTVRARFGKERGKGTSWPLKSGIVWLLRPSQRIASPGPALSRRSSGVIRRLGIASAGMTATRASTPLQAVPYEPRGAPRGSERPHRASAANGSVAGSGQRPRPSLLPNPTGCSSRGTWPQLGGALQDAAELRCLQSSVT